VRLSEKIRRLPGSAVREVFDRANAMEQSGTNVIHLEIGRPWFDTPTVVKDAAKVALDLGRVHYSPSRGIIELRAAIAGKLERENRILADPETEIIVTSGNKQATFLAMNALLNEGDEVVLTDPCYGPHYKEALFVGAVPRLLDLHPEENWTIDAKSLRSVVGAQTKAIVINTPHNPTGRVFTCRELQAIADCAVENDLIVITDETYEYFSYDDAQHVSIGSLEQLSGRTVSTFAFTKSYAMDGWRLGYAVAPATVITGMTKLVQLDTAGPNTFAQYGAIEAAKLGASGAAEMVEEDRKARDLASSRLAEMGIPCPHVEGAIYAFPAIGNLELSDEEFVVRLLEECGVALTPGSAFGKQGKLRVRIAFGAVPIDILDEALDRIEGFVDALG